MVVDRGQQPCVSLSLPYRVFANAETLFYYARPVSPTVKLLSREEIQDLLVQRRDAVSPNVTTVTAPEKEEGRLEGGPSEITPVETLGGREDFSGNDSELDSVPGRGSSPSAVANPSEDSKDQTQAGYHNGSRVDGDPRGSAESEEVCSTNGDPTVAHPELSYMYEDEV